MTPSNDVTAALTRIMEAAESDLAVNEIVLSLARCIEAGVGGEHLDPARAALGEALKRVGATPASLTDADREVARMMGNDLDDVAVFMARSRTDEEVIATLSSDERKLLSQFYARPADLAAFVRSRNATPNTGGVVTRSVGELPGAIAALRAESPETEGVLVVAGGKPF